mgnify:CR=1 FL=1
MKKEVEAFTLLESLVVLAIITMLFLLVVPTANRSKQASAERQFWSDLHVHWQAAQARAKVAHQSTSVVYEPDSHRFEFSWLASRRQTETVAVPSTLVVDFYPRIQILANGYVRPQTLRLHSTLTKQQYQIRVQLGWGGYHVVKK